MPSLFSSAPLGHDVYRIQYLHVFPTIPTTPEFSEQSSPRAIIKYSLQYFPVDTFDNDNEEKSFGDAEMFCGGLVPTSVNVAVEPVIVRFNGTLDFPSIYRGPPSPEIDAAWSRIAGDVLPTRMSLEEILKAGDVDSPSKVKYPTKFDGDFTEVPKLYYTECIWFQDKPEVVRMHLDRISCAIADVTMITWDWVQGHDIPCPNINTRHQCRNYERILDWAVKHAVHIDKSEVTRFEDTVNLPLPFYPMNHLI
ncbi:uncharacterized protein BJ212DRAFT_1302413 [Suillus subaureus]|uniref:Uncharacterized protein n=1 Tax=Suillus subaureus TaxID=48587 RepID=A0A9P7E488_9AGAM|nr:uncharacterized protein BJ212DRAFT_1302413 [Suillus subaureus]KAG1810707.1 hypothetical protein BJ212DRAFT_1302413 [Suillus subaureus]